MIDVPGEIHGMRQDQFVITSEHVKDCVHKSCKNTQDLTGFFDACSRLVITNPSDPSTNSALTSKATCDVQVKLWVRRTELQAEGELQTHTIVKGQCTEQMKDAINQLPTHEKMEHLHDLAELIQKLQLVSHDAHLGKDPVLSSLDMQSKSCSCKQAENQTLSSFYWEFKSRKNDRNYY